MGLPSGHPRMLVAKLSAFGVLAFFSGLPLAATRAVCTLVFRACLRGRPSTCFHELLGSFAVACQLDSRLHAPCRSAVSRGVDPDGGGTVRLCVPPRPWSLRATRVGPTFCTLLGVAVMYILVTSHRPPGSSIGAGYFQVRMVRFAARGTFGQAYGENDRLNFWASSARVPPTLEIWGVVI
eukprot:5708780-Pleurochrysis_carterae.AAC.1